MIKRIFISTNANLHGIFGGRDYANLQTKLTNSGLSLLNNGENHKVYFNGTGFDIATTSSSIIVVIDSSATLLTGINPLTDLLLHHTQTDNHIRNVVEKFEGKKVQGRHPDLYYTEVFKIIFNDNIIDKLPAILKVLGFTEKEVQEKIVLKSKLDFLHFIYNGGIPSKYEGDKSFAEKDLYKTFEGNPYQIDLDMDADETKGAKQRKHLIALRDVLLEE